MNVDRLIIGILMVGLFQNTVKYIRIKKKFLKTSMCAKNKRSKRLCLFADTIENRSCGA